ncbi:hypothetical protein [Pyrobaculum aerophilum]|uniref:hypothetical protein n=1 Tax=Pyrobaculum aerophilum TaxID=13773 RepID=UPI002FD97C0B
MYVIDIGKPKIVGLLRPKNGEVMLRERPIAYGVYHGRLGVETERGVYILKECVSQLVVIADGRKYIIDFSKFAFICR